VTGTDEQLIEGIAGGSEAALRTLEQRYADRLYRYALCRLGHADEARDAAQDTLLAVWTGADGFEGDSSVSTWLFGICRNKVGDRLRRRRAREEPLELAQALARLDHGEDALQLWQCLSQLSDDDHDLVLLVLYCGFSQQQVARIIGIPAGTVKSRTHYARRRLQRLMDGGDGGG